MEINDKRSITPYGLMIADAVLAKTGPLPYTRSELGLSGDPNSVVMLDRSKDTLQDALSTMKGAPVTIDHPDEFINSHNSRNHVVGMVTTEPRIDDDGMVRAEVGLFDEKAIQKVKDGEHQLSPGFDFVLSNLTDKAGKINAMQVNHIAIVRRGRAGASVRISDSLPPAIRHESHGGSIMNDELKEVVTKAVNDAFSQKSESDNFDQTKKELITGVTDGLKGLFDEVIAKFDKAQDEAKKSEEKSANDAAVEDAVKKAIDSERARYEVIMEATPYIAEDQRASLVDKSAEDVLRLAIGDSVKGTDAMGLDVLKGVFLGMSAQKAGDSAKPSGVVKVTDEAKPKKGAEIMDAIYKKRAADRAKSGGAQ